MTARHQAKNELKLICHYRQKTIRRGGWFFYKNISTRIFNPICNRINLADFYFTFPVLTSTEASGGRLVEGLSK
jgi:hypothetical protein